VTETKLGLTDHMGDALELARQALGLSSPNPAVGALIVRDDGIIVGRGFTQEAGGPHAEAIALAEAGAGAAGTTIYTTLEPCSHVGRTPPCARSIVDAGVSQVNVAVLDPNPEVNGRGIQTLRDGGVRTQVGERSADADEHYQAYYKFIRTGVPLLIVKYAMTLDGKIATKSGDSRWISGEASRRRVHDLRSQVGAIITAPGTVAVDDPQLTARGPDGAPLARQPVRVIADSRGRTPPTARLFREPGRTLVVTAGDEYHSPFKELGESVSVASLPDENGRVDLKALLHYLGGTGVMQVMTEVGEVLLGSLFDEGLPDRAMIYIAPKVVGGTQSLGPVAGTGVERIGEASSLTHVRIDRIEDDVLVEGSFRWWAGSEGQIGSV
jgi:diaminohydroxyphosphoribosylaminopyrimidine deaminase/5-amino-6-(5-phosphoribosylamino)uracil reductase